MPRRYADYKGITSAILCLGFRVKATAIGTWGGGVGERGVGTKTKIPLLRLIKGLFGFIKALSKEYGPQHPPSPNATSPKSL